MHQNSNLLFARYAAPIFQDGHDVLEIGPNQHPSTYQQATNERFKTWHTIDIFEDERLTYSKSDPYHFPIADQRYDVVLAGNVLEHVPRIWDWIRELGRIVKPGGYVITVNPVSWPFHAAPVDCWRAYPDGMKELYSLAGLQVQHCSCESLEKERYRRTTPGMTFEHYLERSTWTTRIIYRAAVALGFPAPAAYDTITIGRKPQ